MNIAIIYSTPTALNKKASFVQTDEDTKIVARAVSVALRSLGHTTILRPITPRGVEKILIIKADCLFNLIEWTGRDMHLVRKVYKHIKKIGIPYTGSTVRNYIDTSDKARMKPLFKKHHIPTPSWQLFTNGREKVAKTLHYPLILKAAQEHCSIGLSSDSLAYSSEEMKIKVVEKLTLHKQPILVEEFITGREFQVSVVEKKGKPVVLPIEEVFFSSPSNTSFLTYDSKWSKGSEDYRGTRIKVITPDPILTAQLKRITTRTFKVLGFRGYARFDIRVQGNAIYILEANANPNLYDPDEEEHELAYAAAGMSFGQYLWCIIESAFYHHEKDHKKRHY